MMPQSSNGPLPSLALWIGGPRFCRYLSRENAMIDVRALGERRVFRDAEWIYMGVLCAPLHSVFPHSLKYGLMAAGGTRRRYFWLPEKKIEAICHHRNSYRSRDTVAWVCTYIPFVRVHTREGKHGGGVNYLPIFLACIKRALFKFMQFSSAALLLAQ